MTKEILLKALNLMVKDLELCPYYVDGSECPLGGDMLKNGKCGSPACDKAIVDKYIAMAMEEGI